MLSSSPVSVSEVMLIGPLVNTVSTVMERELLVSEPSVLRLSAPSETVPLAIEMLAVAVELGVGVKMAVRVRPEPLMAERVPPVTETSSDVNEVLGSSEKVKVMEAVSPLFNVEALLVMAREGAWVSKVRAGVVPAPPLFPAASL